MNEQEKFDKLFRRFRTGRKFFARPHVPAAGPELAAAESPHHGLASNLPPPLSSNPPVQPLNRRGR